MKNTIKQILGFLLTALAGFLGYQESAEMFVSFGAIVVAVYVITDLIKNYIPAAAQVLSWVIGVVFALLGWYLELGLFVEMTWWLAGITGFMVSLAVNGVYDSGWIEAAWNLIKQMFGVKPVV
jgi:hypothetical protein